MSKLILVRHGESLWNKKNLFTGWTDVGLTEKGRQEAKQAGILLRGCKIDVCYTSVLIRAIETTEILMKAADLNVPVIENWHLNERHYGALQGLNKAEMAEKYGDDQVHLWRRSYDVRPPLLDKNDKQNPAFDKLYKNLKPKEIPLAESLKDTVSRVIPYYKAEIQPRLLRGENVLVVAHGNSLRALEMFLLNISEDDIPNLNIPTGVPFVFDLDRNLNVVSEKQLGEG